MVTPLNDTIKPDKERFFVIRNRTSPTYIWSNSNSLLPMYSNHPLSSVISDGCYERDIVITANYHQCLMKILIYRAMLNWGSQFDPNQLYQLKTSQWYEGFLDIIPNVTFPYNIDSIHEISENVRVDIWLDLGALVFPYPWLDDANASNPKGIAMSKSGLLTALKAQESNLACKDGDYSIFAQSRHQKHIIRVASKRLDSVTRMYVERAPKSDIIYRDDYGFDVSKLSWDGRRPARACAIYTPRTSYDQE